MIVRSRYGCNLRNLGIPHQTVAQIAFASMAVADLTAMVNILFKRHLVQFCSAASIYPL